MVGSQAIWSRPSGATLHRCWVEQLGALLREREVTGRDASLPAPLLSALGILVARETVGALPQTPQGRCPLTLQGALPLDPFLAPRLERASAALWDSGG